MKTALHWTPEHPEPLDTEKRFNAISLGVLFVWVGIAWLLAIQWGLALLVTGLILLGAQGARRYLALGVEGFWIAIGMLFVLGGIWQSLDVQVGLVPVVLVLAGLALLASTLVHRRAH